MAQAKEKLTNSLSLLDQDVKQWKELQNLIPPARSRARGIQKDEILDEFAQFFSASEKIRGQLVDLLQLVSSVSEN